MKKLQMIPEGIKNKAIEKYYVECIKTFQRAIDDYREN